MRSLLLSCFSLPLFFVHALGQSSTVVVPIKPPSGTAVTAHAADAMADYSAEPIVIEHLDSVYTMAADGTGSRLTTVAARVQAESAVKQLGVVYVAYASSYETCRDRVR